jgi:hypothetical protein
MIVAAGAAVLLVGIGIVCAAVPTAGTAPRASAADPVVARVEGRTIRLSEVQELQRRNMERYQKETGKAAPPAYDTFFLRIGLEEAVRQRLVELDARARGLVVTDAQAESLMKLDPIFRVGGVFDPARFATITSQNPKGFAEAREQARSVLLFQRRMQSLERELDPPAADLAAMMRARDLQAKVRYVLVSDIHYDGMYDPTDEQLRAYYAQHRDDIASPSELAFSAASVSLPEAGPGRAAAKARADSLLAAASAGAAFDSLMRAPGVVSSSGMWRPGTTEGLFATQARLAETALDLAPGSILPGLVESKDALAIVRVDRARKHVVPPLRQVAVDVRARWRAQQIEAEDSAASRRYYDTHPDSFALPAWQVRWAVVDSSRVSPRTPKESDLRAWYDAHQAEFARLDPEGGGIQSRPFEEVKPQVARRWSAEDRALECRRMADELATAWGRGKGGSVRGAATGGGPAWIVAGGALPDGLARPLADSAQSWDRAPHAIVVPHPDGFAVVALTRYEAAFRAPFDVVAPRARQMAFNEKLLAERAGARQWYDSHLADFRTGPGYTIAYVTTPPVPTVQVDVPSNLIERYYREHLTEFGTPPEVHVRHILITTDKRTDTQARELATSILGRVRRGEDFATLARQFSEDPGSKDDGGNLGFIRHGTTVPEFQRAAYALTEARPVSNLVKTQFGYHIIKLIERREGTTPKFEEVRGELGQKLALQYADTLARQAATRLQRVTRNEADLLARADSLKLSSQQVTWYEGQPLIGPTQMDDLRADLSNTAQDAILPRVYRYLNTGYAVAALDTILPPRQLEFEEVQDRVLQAQRQDASRRAARARADQLEHDLASGVPWEQAVETAGGETTTPSFGRGIGLPSLGPVAGLDSLLFGPGTDTLAVNGWRRLATPRGDLFVQLLERSLPESSGEPATRTQLRANVLNRRIYDYIERLRVRYPVEVLRADLAERIPPPPAL